jgi:hypothetical protein
MDEKESANAIAVSEKQTDTTAAPRIQTDAYASGALGLQYRNSSLSLSTALLKYMNSCCITLS